jgi:hypothetical protein
VKAAADEDAAFVTPGIFDDDGMKDNDFDDSAVPAANNPLWAKTGGGSGSAVWDDGACNGDCACRDFNGVLLSFCGGDGEV